MIKGVVPAVVTRICELLKRQFAWTARRAPGAAIAVVAVFALAACTSEKDRLDAEAKRLCAIDGGIRVFEAVPLPPEKFYPSGVPKLPNEKDDQEFGYYKTYQYRNLGKDYKEPTLIRHEYRVVRSSDQKVVAVSVVYRRRGGSWWDGLMEGDGFTCPGDEVNTTFTQQVFIKETQGNQRVLGQIPINQGSKGAAPP